MIGKKFEVVINEFCKKKEMNPADAESFHIFVMEVFKTAKGYMETKEHDFIAIRNFGTFFLKVWAVHNHMVHRRKAMGTAKKERRQRTLEFEYNQLKEIYERMTTDFASRKEYLKERKDAKRRMNIQAMTDMMMDDVEAQEQQEYTGKQREVKPNQDILDALERNFRTSLEKQKRGHGRIL